MYYKVHLDLQNYYFKKVKSKNIYICVIKRKAEKERGGGRKEDEHSRGYLGKTKGRKEDNIRERKHDTNDT